MAILRLTIAILALVGHAFAQDANPPKAVRITFLPPPVEGTFSLGIYDGSGRLVRVLKREAELEDFTAEADALSTTWDGKNDAGENLPAAKYHARGYAVGDVEVEGVGYFFNDFVKDDTSPRIERIENVAQPGDGAFVLLARLAGGGEAMIPLGPDGNPLETWREANEGADFYDFVSPARRNLRVEAGKLFLSAATNETVATWPELRAPVDAAYGRDQTVWVIDTEGGSEGAATVLKQFSGTGEVLRQLPPPGDQPAPRLIRASTSQDRLFLLEANATTERVRALTLVDVKRDGEKPISDWKVDFEKSITLHKDFTIMDGSPVISGGKAPGARAMVKLQPNPLKKDARDNLELTAAFDAQGSYLATADGLPLLRISETANLTRVVLSARDARTIDVFQDDGAVVEQFRVSGLDAMMAFDCGEIELK